MIVAEKYQCAVRSKDRRAVPRRDAHHLHAQIYYKMLEYSLLKSCCVVNFIAF